MNITLSQMKSETALNYSSHAHSSGDPSQNGVYNYTGVMLSTLLKQAQASSNATSVYIQASDGYGETITMQDAMNQNTIIAYARNGSPLTPLKNGGEGPLQAHHRHRPVRAKMGQRRRRNKSQLKSILPISHIFINLTPKIQFLQYSIIELPRCDFKKKKDGFSG